MEGSSTGQQVRSFRAADAPQFLLCRLKREPHRPDVDDVSGRLQDEELETLTSFRSSNKTDIEIHAADWNLSADDER